MSRRLRWTSDDAEIWRLAWPALGALVAEPLYVLADTAIVGRIGTPQLGGLAVAASILLTAHAMFIFLAYGTTAAVARLLGAGEHRRAAHQAVQSIWLALTAGVVLAVVGFVLAPTLVDALGGDDPDVLHNALVYLRISLFGLPAMLVMLAGVGYLRGVQDTKRPFAVALGSAVGNFLLEVVLVYGFDQGIGASALSTVVAQTAAAAVFAWWIKQAVARHQVNLRPDPVAIRRLAIAGWDLLIRTSAMRAGLTVTVAIAARIGTDDLAAHQIVFEIWTILALILDAVAIAGQALIGLALGANQPERARTLGRRMIGWGAVSGVMTGVVVLALSPLLPHVFTSDGAVIALAAFLLLHVGFGQPVAGVVFALDGVLIGAGDLRFLAVAMVGAGAVLVCGGLLVVAAGAGIGWLWAALHAWMATRLVLMLWRFSGSAWQVTGADR
ncbi:MAG: MATE family efflux transporter [Acidimicrobiaceae bacterium]|nr:MATE family efflux transporter [Acidimicrobiaceae bacterium]